MLFLAAAAVTPANEEEKKQGFGGAAQFGPLSSPAQAPQAKSQAELDAYLEIISATEAPDIVKKVDVFASQYPGSAFLGLAYQTQTLAFQRLGDFDEFATAIEKKS